ncbi:hypothetical protein EC991_010848 [Linnemannia zychae]|nr:hypothetical protein EC991_010848 [Linnemannia zychae]
MSHHYAKVAAYDQDQDFGSNGASQQPSTPGGFGGQPPAWTTISTTSTSTEQHHTSSTSTLTTIRITSEWTEVQGRENDNTHQRQHQYQHEHLTTIPMTPPSTTSLLNSHTYLTSSSPAQRPSPRQQPRQLRSSPSQRPRPSPFNISSSRSPGGGGEVDKSWRQQTQQSLRRMILNPFLSFTSSPSSSSSSAPPSNSLTSGAYTLIRDASLSGSDGGAPSSSSSSTTASVIVDDGSASASQHPARIPPTRSVTRPPTNNAVDGVFANIPAKPEVEGQKEDERRPPTYESAVQDVTPPYFEMTVLSPSSSGDSVFGDVILVDGLPVGNIFQFLWNIAVAICFQFLGVLLTYILHNSHASRSGSMAGLGITLVNFGIQMRGGLGTLFGNTDDTSPYNPDTTYAYNPSIGEVTQIIKPPSAPSMDDTGYLGGPPPSSPYGGYEYGAAADSKEMDWLQADLESHWVSMVLMMAGWMILVKALAEYAIAKRTETIIMARPENEDDLEDGDFEYEEQDMGEMHSGGGRVIGYIASEDDV